VRPDADAGAAMADGMLDGLVERLADAVAERLWQDTSTGSAMLLDAAALAQRLQIDVKTVYRHAEDLGAIRVGRALRFDLGRALAAWNGEPSAGDHRRESQAAPTPAAPGSNGTRRRPADAGHCQLLPITGRPPSHPKRSVE
jgi:hypothetical protein